MRASTVLNRSSCDCVSYLINAGSKFRHTAENSSMGNRRWCEGRNWLRNARHFVNVVNSAPSCARTPTSETTKAQMHCPLPPAHVFITSSTPQNMPLIHVPIHASLFLSTMPVSEDAEPAEEADVYDAVFGLVRSSRK